MKKGAEDGTMQAGERDTAAQKSPLHRVRLLWAGAFLSGLVVTDLFLSLFCAGWPLIIYLIAGGLGARLAERLDRRFAGDSLGATIVRRGAIGLAMVSAVGLFALAAMPARWDAHCAWRDCSRAMGPGLLEAPFPVGTPSCGAWMMCANEHPWSPREYHEVLRRIDAQGCPSP